jgi:hypothetical protein
VSIADIRAARVNKRTVDGHLSLVIVEPWLGVLVVQFFHHQGTMLLNSHIAQLMTHDQ